MITRFLCGLLCALSLDSAAIRADDQPVSALVIGALAPQVIQTLPPSGAILRNLSTIEVFFSEDVTNVDPGDLLVNGVPAEAVSSFGASQYVFTVSAPARGTVTISWAGDSGIQDLAGNAFLGTSWVYALDPSLPTDQPVISEFMADNSKTLNDEDGDSSDWLEIFNPSSEPLELTGWYLSNDTNNFTRWQFPAITMDPNSYLVVFASEKNRTNTGGRLHTNFKLATGGGFLALSDSSGKLISGFDYPGQRKDVSFGREPSNPSLTGFFSKPTPGLPNAPGGPDFAPKVHFSRKGGTFVNPFELTVTTDLPNAQIYYSTVNGKTLPTEASNLYTGPIVISKTTHLRARAFVPGLLPGEPHSESFIVLTGAVVNVTSDLPLVILHNYGAGAIPASGEQFMMMQIFEPKNGVSSLTNSPDLSERGRFRLRGSSTQDYPKPSLSLELWDEFNSDKKVKVLGMPEESDWNFYAPNNFEPVLIHNPFMYQLSRDIGRYASRTRFVEVYLSTRGGNAVATNNYYGIYVIEEKIKRGPDRVDVDKLEPEHLNPPQVTGGYMLKIDRSDPGDFSFSVAGVSDLNYVDPKGPVIRTFARDPQEQYLLGYLRSLGSVLNNTTLFTDPNEGYAKYVDTSASIDFHILNVLAFNVDALRLSTYLYKPRNGKLAWGPIWDFDRALGSTDGRDASPKTWGNSGGTSFFEWPLWNRMFLDPNFYQKWIDRWEELRLAQLSTARVNALIDQLTGQVVKAQPREYARWRSQAPVRGSYQNEINLMKNYVKNRSEFIDAQFVRPPVPSIPTGPVRSGATVALAATNTIYYTLDGTDPRLPGGAISPFAVAYSSPISLSVNARLVARAYEFGHSRGPTVRVRSPWSGVVSATYVVETPKLAITEIMYHPAPAPAGSTNSTSDYEFIELKNVGTTPLRVNGISLTRGISFAFTHGTLQPGERTVLVKNRAAFVSRYGPNISIAGEFTGSLNNDQQRLVLEGALREPIADFTYHSEWYPVTDGPGFSLVLRDETNATSYGEKSIWRASAHPGGSPGASDPTPASVSRVLINEVLSHPVAPQVDQVELYNPGLQAVDIGGWFLSDDLGAPKRFQIPSGTTIPALGYVVLDETQFSANGKGFGFSSGGDGAYLFSGDNSAELTGYVHGFQFGAAAPGVSFGRFITLDNREHFVAQARPTFGGANSGPLVGPVILSEIMFEPPKAGSFDNTLDEYIELQNLSAQPLSLSSWHLRGGTDFDFPSGATIAGSNFVLIVNFDPKADPGFETNFRSKYNVPASVPVYGPYQSKLSNGGGRVALLRPDVANSATDPAYVLVEEVNYSSSLPWPTGANATGQSIQRNPFRFGDDPFSWLAGAPNPGSQVTQLDPDPDRDGLPSEWEIAHGLNPNDPTGANGPDGDPDGDGSTNVQEYLAGTDPQSATSILRLTGALAGGRTSLTFEAAAGKSYSILYKSDLSQNVWLKLIDIPAGAVELKAIPDSSTDPVRFYRLVTPQQ